MSRNVHRGLLAAAVLVVAFAVATALVAAGWLQWLDQYALDHWMPGFTPAPAPGGSRGLWRPFPLSLAWWERPLALWTYPASFLLSGLVVAGAAVLFWRRRRARVALIWIVAWLVGNGVEWVGKATVGRPPFSQRDGDEIVPFDGFHASFPSGHTIRALIVAGVVVSLWPRSRRPAAGWFLATAVLLVVLADHTPSDVIGGFFIGLAIVLVAWVASGTAWAQTPVPG